jgi:HEAT repeat protein
MKANAAIAIFLCTASVLAPWSSRAEQPQPAPAGSGTSSRDNDASLYGDGTRAINEARWPEAVSLFDRVAQLRGEHAEGALYWKAYAQNKEFQSAAALSTCAELRRQYPRSRWLEECGALQIEIRGRSGDPVSPQTQQDDDLKLLALNALIQQDSAQAVPILQKVLAGSQSDELKARALFVLAQRRSPQADALLSQIAHGQSGPALQIKAIRIIAAAWDRQADDTLADIYQHSTSAEVKRAVLQSYLITGNSSKLLAVARQEGDPALLKTAIHTLGAMKAAKDLLDVYRSTSSAETKADIINAFLAGGHDGVAPLTEILQSEQDGELVRKAIRNLGIAGGMSVAPTLVAVYQKGHDVEARRAAAQALFLANDAHDLVALARVEKDTAMKAYLVQQLSHLQDPEATGYMLEILSK